MATGYPTPECLVSSTLLMSGADSIYQLEDPEKLDFFKIDFEFYWHFGTSTHTYNSYEGESSGYYCDYKNPHSYVKSKNRYNQSIYHLQDAGDFPEEETFTVGIMNQRGLNDTYGGLWTVEFHPLTHVLSFKKVRNAINSARTPLNNRPVIDLASIIVYK